MTLSPNENDRLWREPERTSGFHFPNLWRYGIGLFVLLGVLMGLWYFLSSSHKRQDKALVPLIKADQEPYKMKAASQGVPSIKHQDKLVYGRIRADQNGPVTEHILPDPEAPLPHIKSESEAIKMVEQYAPEDGDPGKIADVIEPKKEEKVPTLTSIADLIDETPEEKPAAEKKVEKGKKFIQLASLKTCEMAESEWERLSKKHADILGGLKPLIQKIDLGANQGIYYRLRTGPFDDVEKANKACAILKEGKIDCVVVK